MQGWWSPEAVAGWRGVDQGCGDQWLDCAAVAAYNRAGRPTLTSPCAAHPPHPTAPHPPTRSLHSHRPPAAAGGGGGAGLARAQLHPGPTAPSPAAGAAARAAARAAAAAAGLAGGAAAGGGAARHHLWRGEERRQGGRQQEKDREHWLHPSEPATSSLPPPLHPPPL